MILLKIIIMKQKLYPIIKHQPNTSTCDRQIFFIWTDIMQCWNIDLITIVLKFGICIHCVSHVYISYICIRHIHIIQFLSEAHHAVYIIYLKLVKINLKQIYGKPYHDYTTPLINQKIYDIIPSKRGNNKCFHSLLLIFFGPHILFVSRNNNLTIKEIIKWSICLNYQ